MRNQHDSQFLDDPEFQSLLVACLESLQRGENIDRDALEKDFPKYADEIGQFLENRQMLEQAVDQFGDVEPSQVAIAAYEQTSQVVPYRPNSPGTVQLWNIQTGEAGPIVEIRESGVFGVAYQDDGRRLASAGEDGRLVLHDLETLDVVKTPGTGSLLRSVDLSSNGRLVIVGTEDGKVIVWDVKAAQVAATLKLDAVGTVHCVAMSSTGHSIVAANPWRFCVWEWPSGKELCVITRAGIRCAAFDAEGKRVAVGIDGNVQIFETQDWDRIGEFSAHSQPLHRLAFSPSGNRLATRADDGTLKVWDLESLQRLLVLKLSDAQLNEHFAPRFSPDETLLLGDRIGDQIRLFAAPRP